MLQEIKKARVVRALCGGAEAYKLLQSKYWLVPVSA